MMRPVPSGLSTAIRFVVVIVCAKAGLIAVVWYGRLALLEPAHAAPPKVALALCLGALAPLVITATCFALLPVRRFRRK